MQFAEIDLFKEFHNFKIGMFKFKFKKDMVEINLIHFEGNERQFYFPLDSFAPAHTKIALNLK